MQRLVTRAVWFQPTTDHRCVKEQISPQGGEATGIQLSGILFVVCVLKLQGRKNSNLDECLYSNEESRKKTALEIKRKA